MRKLPLLLVIMLLIVPGVHARDTITINDIGQTAQTLDLQTGKFKQNGVTINFGNAANQVPILDGSAKLNTSTIPGLPASIITSGSFADARIASASIWNAKENALTFSGPLSRSTNTISIPAATASVDGYLSASNFTIFNAKESALTFSTPLARSTNTISLPAATGSVNGYLASGDWTTFNNKVATTRTLSTTAPLGGGGDLSANRTLTIAQATTSVDGYLSATDWTTFNAKVGATRTINATAPITGGGDLSANRTLAMAAATTSVDGYLSASNFTIFNNKVGTARTINTASPITGGGDLSADRTIAIPVATGSVNGYLSSGDWTTFNNKESALTFTNGITRSTNTIGLGAITPSSVTTAGVTNASDHTIGITGSYSANVVFEGDSITQQVSDVTGAPNGYNNYMGAAAGDGVAAVPAIGTYNGIAVSPSVGQNVAVAGKTTNDLYETAARVNALFRQEAGMNVVVYLAGTNNLGLSPYETAEQTYSHIEAICKHHRQMGWRVILVGLTSRGGTQSGTGTAFDTLVGQVNGLLRQNWAQFADRFIDWGVINGGSNEFNLGGYSNTTWYGGDQLHHTFAGGRKLASYVQPVINELLTYYFQRQSNQLYVHMNKATHTNVYAEGMLTLNNENPSAGQDEINFAFNKVLKANIRADFNGTLNFGATGYVADYIGSTGPDVYGTNGSNGPPLIFYRDTNLVQSSRPFQILSSTVGGPSTGKGLEMFYSSGVDFSFIQSYDHAGSAWKGMYFGASQFNFAPNGAINMQLTSAGLTVTGADIAISHNVTGASTVSVSNTTSTGYSHLSADNGTNSVELGIYGTSKASYGMIGAGEGFLYNGTTLNVMADGSGVIKFAAGGNSEKMRLTSTGLTVNGITTETTGAGFALSSGGSNTKITEAWGVNLNGDSTHPVTVKSTALLVGFTPSGGSYSAGDVSASGNVTAKHYGGNGTAPTISTGSQIGSGGTVSFGTGSTDASGLIAITTGTGPGTGDMATVTFNAAYNVAPFPELTGATTATTLVHPTATSSTTVFTVYFASAPAAGTTYYVFYHTQGN